MLSSDFAKEATLLSRRNSAHSGIRSASNVLGVQANRGVRELGTVKLEHG